MVVTPTPYKDASDFTQLTGIFIERAPIPVFNAAISLQHQTYHTLFCYRDAFNLHITPRTRIIASARNPYTRTVSDLFANGMIRPNSTPEYVHSRLPDYLSSNDLDNHNIPQSDFIVDEYGFMLKNIHIVRTETLREDMQRLGYTDFAFYLNRGPLYTRDYMKYLNVESIHLINDYYKRDFEMLGYPMIPTT
jgi:hypothetical protein